MNENAEGEHFMDWKAGWERIKNWGSYSKNLLGKAITVNLRIIGYLLQQLIVMPQVLYSLVAHPGTRKVSGRVLRVSAENVLLPALVLFANQQLQEKGQAYLKDNPDEAWLSSNTLFILILNCLNLGMTLYQTRAFINFFVRSKIIELMAPAELQSAVTKKERNICIEAQCEGFPKINSGAREALIFIGFDLAAKGFSWIPLVGPTGAILLSIYANGQLIESHNQSRLCAAHREQYYRQYRERLLSLGFSHWLLTKVISDLIEAGTGIPSSYYKTGLGQLFILFSVSLALQMPELPAVLKSERTGLTVEKIKGYTQILWSNPLSNKIKLLAIPSILGNWDELKKDPVIGTYANDLREMLLMVLKAIEARQQSLTVKVAAKMPITSVISAELFFDIPKEMGALLLYLLSNEYFKQMVSENRRRLEAMYSGANPSIPPVEGMPVRGVNFPKQKQIDEPLINTEERRGDGSVEPALPLIPVKLSTPIVPPQSTQGSIIPVRRGQIPFFPPLSQSNTATISPASSSAPSTAPAAPN